MLSQDDLDFMRSQIGQLMPDVCTILAPVDAPDGQGGHIQTWGTVSSNVSCRIDPGRRLSFEALAGGAVQPFDFWILTLPHDTVINATHRVVCNGALYNVEGVDGGKSWKASVRATLRQV